jgi:hypothetical protein
MNEIELANENAKLLQKLFSLMTEFKKLCEKTCKNPEKNQAYLDAKSVFK